MARFQQKYQEQGCLEQRRAELASLRTRHADACAVLQRLRDDIRRFELEYDRTLGRRIAELERIEAEITRLTGKPRSDSRWEDSWEDSWENPDTSPEQERNWRAEPQDIKSLYREVAKTVHPDLAGSASGEIYRNELMSMANRAYQANDSRALQEILRNWKPEVDYGSRDVANVELARVERQIAEEQRELAAVNSRVEELRNSYVCRLKLRIDDSRGAGNDLFAEMVAAVDTNIARALKRLAVLKQSLAREAAQQRRKAQRTLQFPEDVCCGTLFLRPRYSSDYSQWKEFGPAIGSVEIDVDQAARLDVKEHSGKVVEYLQKLRPYDLQSLYLYDASDADLLAVSFLTGLEELYLSGLRLTDASLSCITSLSNLKRVYIYQTSISDQGLVHLQSLPNLQGITSSGNSITDDGLARFQRAIPRVKTVSFQWKR